jgi:hypothetical protein
MRVVFHPEFPKDIRKFEVDYKAISDGRESDFAKKFWRRLMPSSPRPKAPDTTCKRDRTSCGNFGGETFARFRSSFFTV